MATFTHVRCGTDIERSLHEAGIAPAFLSWADPVCQGPLGAEVQTREWYAMRAEFLANSYGADRQSAASELLAADEAFAAAVARGDAVLWFEHDLYDQSILVCLLARVPEDAEVHLVQSGSYLGEASSETLRALFDARAEVTSRQKQLARRAWQAFQQGRQEPIERLLGEGTGALPYLDAALRRHLEELPPPESLGRTDRIALGLIEAGVTGERDLFHRYCETEPARWLGDTMFFARLRRMQQAPDPLIEPGPLRLTAAGRRMLDGNRSTRPL